jgi:hypothetical protein
MIVTPDLRQAYTIECRMEAMFEAWGIEGQDWPWFDDEVRQEAEQQLAHSRICGPIEGSDEEVWAQAHRELNSTDPGMRASPPRTGVPDESPMSLAGVSEGHSAETPDVFNPLVSTAEPDPAEDSGDL